MADTVAPLSNDLVTFDAEACVVKAHGERAELSPIEATIFGEMLAGKGVMITHKQILHAMYPARDDIVVNRASCNLLRVHMNHIRNKLVACRLKRESVRAVRPRMKSKINMIHEGGYLFKPVFKEAEEVAQTELESEPIA